MIERQRWYRFVVVTAAVGLLLATAASRAADRESSLTRLKRDIAYLASDECEGRGVETEGIHKAADFIADQFKQAGLKPGGTEGTWFQPFKMGGPATLAKPNTLRLTGPLGQEIELKVDQDFRPLGLSAAGKVKAPVVFLGYGARAKGIGYDDFKGVDVAGKVVVVIRKTPRADNPQVPFDGQRSAQHAALMTKLVNADLHKAIAVLFVNDRGTARDGDPLMDFRYTAGDRSGAKLPALHLRRAVVDSMLRASLDTTLREIEDDIDRDLKPHSAPLPGWTAQLQVSVARKSIPAKNVVGVLEGKGKLAKETVVIGAHYDHLGFGGSGSLARNLKGPAIHYGADDNASGTTTLIELARRLAVEPAAGDRRRLVFIAFSGEESGLIGSDYYCKNPLYPLADTAAMLNLDMVGRLRPDQETKKDALTVYGTGSAKTFDSLIERRNAKYGFKLSKVASGMGPSDHASFYAKQVPVLFFFTGLHNDYHRPSDTADKINVEGMLKVADLVEELAQELAITPQRPEYVLVKGRNPSRSGGPRGPRLGIQPNYSDDKEGVLLDGVAPDGPAEKGGLKGGDRIVELGGKPLKDLQTYMVLMGNYKSGDVIELTVVRGKKKLTVKVKPE